MNHPKTIAEYLIEKYIDSVAGTDDARKVDVAEELRIRLASFAKFADDHLRTVRPVAVSHGYEGNYRIQLNDRCEVVVAPVLELPPGAMQESAAVAMRENQEIDPGGVVATPSLRI